MKRIKKFLSAVLAAALLSVSAVTGASAAAVESPSTPKMAKVPGSETDFICKNGKELVCDGIPAAAVTDGAFSSYEVRSGGETLLTVTLNGFDGEAAVGAEPVAFEPYYTVEFALKDNKIAFATGLTAGNVDTLQDELMRCMESGEQLVLENIDFIDTEKQGLETVHGDSDMCWAAASANILSYTGWAQKAGFRDCDDMFEALIDAFPNEGGYNSTALAWFINGADNNNDDMDMEEERPEVRGGGFFPEYAYDMLCREGDFTASPVTAMKGLIRELHSGSGVLLSVSSIADGFGLIGGHTVSCWGYVTDDNYDDDEKEHYSRLLITDSDSDLTANNDRRTAPNILSSVSLAPFEQKLDMFLTSITVDSWSCEDYSDFILSDYMAVSAYSDDLPKETLLRATRNKKNTVDFSVNDISVSGYNGFLGGASVSAEDDVLLGYSICNNSEMVYDGDLRVKIEIAHSSGYNIITMTENTAEYLNSFDYSFHDDPVNLGKLPEGRYTASLTVNPQRSVREAYYYNNSSKFSFTVSKPAVDTSQLSMKAVDPRVEDNTVVYDLRFEGFTDEVLSKITHTELRAVEYDEGMPDPDGGSKNAEPHVFSYAADCDYDEETHLPLRVRVLNETEYTFALGLSFKDAPDSYICSEQYLTEFPEIGIGETEDIIIEFTPVESEATGFANGEKLSFTLYGYDEKEVSGAYHIEAFNIDTNETFDLTKSVSFTAKLNDPTVYTVTDFDYTLPDGEYVLQVIIEGDIIYNDMRNNYSYLTVGKGESRLHYPGDVDRDDILTINDATDIQKYLAKFIDFDDEQLALADVDGDGFITINDVTTIQKILVE